MANALGQLAVIVVWVFLLLQGPTNRPATFLETVGFVGACFSSAVVIGYVMKQFER